jgi:PRC-barrel domain
MLWDASSIHGYAVEASDGRLGTVSDLLFEDFDWTVKWLVVDTGNWLSGRKVLLPLSALGRPDAASRQFPVKLTMRQVRDSPDINTDMAVSRQMETDVYNYYGWSPYWSGGPFPTSNAKATPLVAPLSSSGPRPGDPGGADTQPKPGDPHLRSAAAVTGHHIHALDGEIGHAADFLVDDAGWIIRYIIVDTKNWWPGEKVLVSPRSVREINWADKKIHLDVKRQMVKGAPPYNPAVTVDGAYDEKFLTYYGIKWVAA